MSVLDLVNYLFICCCCWYLLLWVPLEHLIFGSAKLSLFCVISCDDTDFKQILYCFPNTFVIPLELDPAVVCWWSIHSLQFQKWLQKTKSGDTFWNFHFQSEERAPGLICRVDLISKCCCVKPNSFFISMWNFNYTRADWPGCSSFDPHSVVKRLIEGYNLFTHFGSQK